MLRRQWSRQASQTPWKVLALALSLFAIDPLLSLSVLTFKRGEQDITTKQNSSNVFYLRSAVQQLQPNHLLANGGDCELMAKWNTGIIRDTTLKPPKIKYRIPIKPVASPAPHLPKINPRLVPQVANYQQNSQLHCFLWPSNVQLNPEHKNQNHQTFAVI